jgi:NADH-quinone oxidoreductase subunit C
MLLNNYIKMLKNCMPFEEIAIVKKEIVVVVPVNLITYFMYFLKKHEVCRFDLLVDICGVDYPEQNLRFEIIYNLLSINYNQRLFIKVYTCERKSISSISQVFMNSVWFEREVWDMFGVFIHSHPDLRKILTDYGFSQYPLRKDFPVTGFYDLSYSDFDKIIVKSYVEFSQESRIYNYTKI